MKILFVANWKIHYLDESSSELQPSDYCCKKEPFWFFKYFKKECEVDVLDISSSNFIMKLEKKAHFIFHNLLKLIRNRKKYDIIMFHGTNGAVFFLLLKRIFRFKTAPIAVVDISSFHQASTSGFIFKLCKFVSHEIDYLFYHTSSQSTYFKEYFPWLTDKMSFVNVGVDYAYWNSKYKWKGTNSDYCVCVGYRKRDWDTLIKAYEKSNIKEKLILIGNDQIKISNKNIKLIPFIPIGELMEYLENAKFSIIPLDNFNYSFGQLTILQQMAIGLPIISADVYAVKDYINFGEGVLKYKPYDADDLSDKLNELSNMDYKMIKEMSASNKNVIKNTLAERNMALFFEDKLEKLLDKKMY